MVTDIAAVRVGKAGVVDADVVDVVYAGVLISDSSLLVELVAEGLDNLERSGQLDGTYNISRSHFF